MSRRSSSRISSSRISVFAVLLLFAAPAAAIPATFQVVSSSNYDAGAPAVSADGTTVLTYMSPGYGATINRWRAGASTYVTGGDYVSWGGLSADGSVLVGGQTAPGQAHRAFWWQNGQLTYLGVGATTARDISADGSTIVGRGTSIAYRYQAGVVTPLGDLEGGADSSEAWAVNGDGSVIVGQGTSASGAEAFRWVGGQMSGLGDLAGGAFASEAHDTSLDGSVVVGWGTTGSGLEAFRWQSGVMTGLGLLDGTYQTRARGVSGDGSLVVGEAITDPDPNYDFLSEKVALIWDGTGMHVLQDWLLQQYGLDLTGYQLRSALGVSSDGRTIVGEGWYYPGSSAPQRIGWVVVVPEPATAPLLLSALIAMAAGRRRSWSR